MRQNVTHSLLTLPQIPETCMHALKSASIRVKDSLPGDFWLAQTINAEMHAGHQLACMNASRAINLPFQ